MDKGRIEKERKRLESLLNAANISQQVKNTLAPLIENLSVMRIKLEEAAGRMVDEPLVVEYDNGGGQTGIRENPFYKTYLGLWRGFLLGFEKFTSYLPADLQEEERAGLSVLDKVRQMKGSA